MQYLIFDLSEGDDGVHTLDAMASTSQAQHAEVMAEVQQVLDWAWRREPRLHGPAHEGMRWDHDLQVVVEDDWHTVTLTLTGPADFVEDFVAAFRDAMS